jgi:hypothetical protein
MGSQELFPWVWLQTAIPLISTSWVAGITGVSHGHPAWHTPFVEGSIVSGQLDMKV